MSAKERLQDVQAALVARGVRDVKFFFSKDVRGVPNTDVKQQAAALLGGYLAGRSVELQSIYETPLAV